MKKISLFSVILGLTVCGCLDTELPTSQTVERYICPSGLVPAAPVVTECPADMEAEDCVVLANGDICVKRMVDSSGGAGHNCEAGWITVSDSEFGSICVESEEDVVENETYYCKLGEVQGRYCRKVPDEEYDLSKTAVLGGQRCTEDERYPPENTLRIHVIDVGQGDALWIQTPTGQNVLVDAGDGGAYGKTSAGPIITDYLAFNGFEKGSKFDAVFLTHPHSDHFGGMATIFGKSGYEIKNYIDPMSLNTAIEVPSSYKSWITQMKKMVDEKHIYMPAEEKFEVGGAFPTEFFGPNITTEYIYSKENNEGNPNASSIIFRIEFAGRSMIFTGDAEQAQEIAAINSVSDLTTNFLKVCHHGSTTSSDPRFLHALWDGIPIEDRAAFISSGREDFSGVTLPRTEVVDCLKLGTCNNGTPFVLEENLFSTEAGDYNKKEDEAYRDDNILIVVYPNGNYYACYSGTN